MMTGAAEKLRSIIYRVASLVIKKGKGPGLSAVVFPFFTRVLSHISNSIGHFPKSYVVGLLALLSLPAGYFGWGLFLVSTGSFFGPVDLSASFHNSQIVVDRQERLLRAFTTNEGRWRLPVEPEDVSPHYYKLLLNFEDKGFYQHKGIEPLALLRAAMQWAQNGRIISGGSTLTMQVARLLASLRDNESEDGTLRDHHFQQRSIATKLLQMKLALQLEHQLSKREILKLYLQLAPFGGNLEGVRAASLAYFGKEPKSLSLAEAATLVAIPQSPEVRRPDRFSKRTLSARNRVLKRAFDNGVIDKGDYLYALRQKMITKRQRFPMIAPHLAEQVVKQKPDGAILKTTINRPLQEKLEVLAKSHSYRLGKGISAAILVINHKTGEVLAHVGAADYHDHERFGPIDMTHGIRSPGSTLKPFIYGMGFDAGLAHPETLIEDAPVRYGLYTPENFDGKFHGTVTIRKALQKSLNIPAVKMLASIKPSRFAARFRYAGLHKSMPNNLTIALGGVGFSLFDLSKAYLHIANPGQAIEVHEQPLNKPVSQQTIFRHRPLLSEKAAFYVSHILRGAAPPKNAKPGELAYKTGTSYGYRDGWAIGFDGQHLVAVWIGRPDGGPTTNLTGIGSAGPLLFDAFQHIGERRVAFAPGPKGVLRASGDDLPPPLRYFDRKKRLLVANTGSAIADKVQIAFPPKDAEFHMPSQLKGKYQIALKAEGGKLPLTWLVDGKMIKSKPFLRESLYKPDEKGFVEFSVIDALGKTDRVQIRVR